MPDDTNDDSSLTTDDSTPTDTSSSDTSSSDDSAPPIEDHSDDASAAAGADAFGAPPTDSSTSDSSSTSSSSSSGAAGNAAMGGGGSGGGSSTPTGTVITKTQAYLDAGAALQAAASAAGAGTLSQSAQALVLGQAFGESFFGRAVQGYNKGGVFDMAGTNNWGSIQANPAWETSHQGRDYFGKFAHTDYHADGVTKYVGWYRIYPNQLEAAKAFLSQIMYGNPTAFAAAVNGGPSSYAQWLHDHGYFEASVSQYTTMLQRNSGEAAAALASGGSAADPSSAGFAEYSIASVSGRVSSGSGAVNPPSGIVWYGKPMPQPGSIGAALGGTLGKVLLGLGAIALLVGGFLFMKGHRA